MPHSQPPKERLQVHVIESCSRLRAGMAHTIFSLGHHCELYTDLSELVSHAPGEGIIMARGNFEEGGVARLLETLLDRGIWFPVIATDTDAAPERVVAAIKAGAIDFLALPVETPLVERCLSRVAGEMGKVAAERRQAIDARDRLSVLSQREREVLDYLAAGGTNKFIAHQLNISPRTVEFHRASMMAKVGARHPSEAVRLRIASGEPLLIAA